MKNIQQIMVKLGFSVKKELTRAIIINVCILLVFIIAYFLLKNPLFIAIGIFLLSAFNYLYFSRYDRMQKTILENAKADFVSIFTFFKIYLHNGYSVYSALKEISSFADDTLSGYLNELIQDIDKDKTVEPFVRFGRRFNDLVIEEMMISVFQMVDDGSDSSYLSQFELIFSKVSDVSYEKELNKKRNSLGTMTTFPLIGSAVIIVMVTFGVITVMGEMVNVL